MSIMYIFFDCSFSHAIFIYCVFISFVNSWIFIFCCFLLQNTIYWRSSFFPMNTSISLLLSFVLILRTKWEAMAWIITDYEVAVAVDKINKKCLHCINVIFLVEPEDLLVWQADWICWGILKIHQQSITMLHLNNF